MVSCCCESFPSILCHYWILFLGEWIEEVIVILLPCMTCFFVYHIVHILKQVDGMDVFAVKQACKFAKEHALKNGPLVSTSIRFIFIWWCYCFILAKRSIEPASCFFPFIPLAKHILHCHTEAAKEMPWMKRFLHPNYLELNRVYFFSK